MWLDVYYVECDRKVDGDGYILHLELKRAERLDHVAEDEQQVAHAQGAEQRVEQTFHHPEWECDVDALDFDGGDIYADVDVVVQVYRLL